jgi:hypothetical protein
VVLPPYSNSNLGENRDIYLLEAKRNQKYEPFTIATTSLIKEKFKLVYYFGYEGLGPGEERIELYNLDSDPEEISDLYQSKRGTAAELLNELQTKLVEVNEPFQ